MQGSEFKPQCSQKKKKNTDTNSISIFPISKMSILALLPFDSLLIII
jgi:hypothetical protein